MISPKVSLSIYLHILDVILGVHVHMAIHTKPATRRTVVSDHFRLLKTFTALTASAVILAYFLHHLKPKPLYHVAFSAIASCQVCTSSSKVRKDIMADASRFALATFAMSCLPRVVM